MKNLFLLFTAVALLLTIKTQQYVGKQKRFVRVDVLSSLTIDKEFTLFIPRSIKFGDKLVNESKDGFVFINVATKTYCYKRSVGITRNEYYINAKCSDETRTVDVVNGDKINVTFDKSNMKQPGNVPLFGEEFLDV